MERTYGRPYVFNEVYMCTNLKKWLKVIEKEFLS